MGLFGSKSAADAVKVPAKGASPGGLSVVATGMTVRGDIESNGIVKVEGAVEGQVLAKDQVLVARGGVVHGDVDTREAVVGGMVNGSIHASERVEVQSGATVVGDITTRRIAVAEGGILNGQIRMSEAAGAPVPTRTPGSGQDVKVNSGRAEPKAPGTSPARPSIPVARVAVPPRTTSPGPGY